ncbi:large conductance mechanosensitive channel protein MscL [Bavariicoccus seileri]|uniref:large conductance mechanosensitive channel protein MscL n=1 Tax=Bavariicoccus seileri TaxID=549685 RepID=UPI0003B5A50E|nr:large conductance mechanosensitive channel protein MscL [Bavariicoccus seileri]
MLKEFRDFLMRGNVIDLAVGVIIGAAFSAIVTSLVNDIIMPLITATTGAADVSDLAITIGNAKLAYGNFLQAIINFVIIGFVLFMIIKAVNSVTNRLSKKATTPEVAVPTAEDYLKEIRDLLANDQKPVSK